MRNQQIIVDLQLLKKYDRPGPRYTSYPTAPYFHDGIGPVQYQHHIETDEAATHNPDLSLYVHLPFCDTLCYFCGCNMMVTHSRDKVEQYLDYLEKEMQLLSASIQPGRKVMQLHWGGGTPTHLTPDQIRRLGAMLHHYFPFHTDAEIGVEIDPRELTREHVVALHEVGFNRCSMGVQDFEPTVQKAINRIQPEAVTRQVVDWARELGLSSINLDIMYGLPHQTRSTFADTLDKILSLDPDRLAVFNYAHLPRMFKHQGLIQDEWLPAPEEKLELLKLSIETLTAAGYVYIGMDHFAKPENELAQAMEEGTLYRNFQGYSTHSGLNLIALGMSSISMLSSLYVQNHKTLPDYYQALDAGKLPTMRGVELTADDRLRREVIVELMCNFVLKKGRIEEKYAITFDEYFADALHKLEPFVEDDLVALAPDKITVTTAGRLLIRNIVMNFDKYLQEKADNKPQFSRTV
ncbi:MAG: oxygen-independent coproporphyrinogen III oxidase [Caldilineaceae bacterium]|nr:oxygen-independent coproporphyrinogen III oxidase [Caldilineaceae bacterium]